METTEPTEEFKRWFRDTYSTEFTDHERDYYAGQWSDMIQDAWDHQQEKIDKLEAKLYPSSSLAQHFADSERIAKLESDNAKLAEALKFYTHEKERDGYGCGKVMGLISGHRYDIACAACNEENKGKRARQTLKEVGEK